MNYLFNPACICELVAIVSQYFTIILVISSIRLLDENNSLGSGGIIINS